MRRIKTLAAAAIVLVAIAAISATMTIGPANTAARTTPTTLDPAGNTVKIDSTINAVKLDSAANTVKIDSGANAVTASSPHQTVQLWSTNQVLANGGFTDSVYINCAGYKQLRVSLGTSLATSNANLKINIAAHTPTGGYAFIAQGNFGAPSHTWDDQANITATGGFATFTVPVLCDVMHIQIYNATGASVTIYNWSWAYAVN